MQKPKPNGSERPAANVRCAIYMRKSTDEGLDRDFNSTGAPQNACPEDSGLIMSGSPRDRNVRTRLGSSHDVPECACARFTARPV